MPRALRGPLTRPAGMRQHRRWANIVQDHPIRSRPKVENPSVHGQKRPGHHTCGDPGVQIWGCPRRIVVRDSARRGVGSLCRSRGQPPRQGCPVKNVVVVALVAAGCAIVGVALRPRCTVATPSSRSGVRPRRSGTTARASRRWRSIPATRTCSSRARTTGRRRRPAATRPRGGGQRRQARDGGARAPAAKGASPPHGVSRPTVYRSLKRIWASQNT
jgi:hypothetical protein